MPIVFVISAPSGTGKSTLANRVVEGDSRIEFAISVTTRPPRVQESDGKDYHFVSEERFLQMRDNGEFLEWAEVFGSYYGTPVSAVDDAQQRGRDVLLDIDVQGASLLKDRLPHAVRIFILPPSSGMLESRLRKRASDDEAAIRRRLDEAAREIGEHTSYDYVVVNDEVAAAVESLRAILSAERSKRQQMKPTVDSILSDFGIPSDANSEVCE